MSEEEDNVVRRIAGENVGRWQEYNSLEFINKPKLKKKEIIEFCDCVIDLEKSIIMENIDSDLDVRMIDLDIITCLYTRREIVERMEEHKVGLEKRWELVYNSLVLRGFNDIRDSFIKVIKKKIVSLIERKYYEFKYINVRLAFYDFEGMEELYFSYRRCKGEELRIYENLDVRERF